MSVGICYDMRFPEPAMVAARRGSLIQFYPGAFNMTTGPLHWELLLRSRAVDNQLFAVGVSPARDTTASYVAWGNSTVVDPRFVFLLAIEWNETDYDVLVVVVFYRNWTVMRQRLWSMSVSLRSLWLSTFLTPFVPRDRPRYD